jgi:hypothetical protein
MKPLLLNSFRNAHIKLLLSSVCAAQIKLLLAAAAG